MQTGVITEGRVGANLAGIGLIALSLVTAGCAEGSLSTPTDLGSAPSPTQRTSVPESVETSIHKQTSDELYDEAIAASGAIAYWPLGINDEWSPTELVSKTQLPSASPLEALNGRDMVDGPGSLSAVAFDATRQDQFLTGFNPQTAIGDGAPWSIDGWLLTENTKPQTMLGAFDGPSDRRWHVSTRDGSLVFAFGALPGGFVETGIRVADGLWHHVGVTVDTSAGLASLYLDGSLVTQNTLSVIPQPASARVAIGSIYRVDGSVFESFWDGGLTRIAVFDRALGENELRNRWERGTE